MMYKAVAFGLRPGIFVLYLETIFFNFMDIRLFDHSPYGIPVVVIGFGILKIFCAIIVSFRFWR